MVEQFISVPIEEILVGVPLPTSVYIYIEFRFITFRAEGDVIDRVTFDRLQQKNVKTFFIVESSRDVWTDWKGRRASEEKAVPPLPPELSALPQARVDAHRKLFDIFGSDHPDRVVIQTMETSKNLVTEVMKAPFAVSSLAQLQKYSQGTVDHSVNVSVLSVYLAMQMGYSHTLILQHVGLGALLHDLGKSKIPIEEGDGAEVIEQKLKSHPELGVKLIEQQHRVPNEVKMIIAQHHECADGSGYPKGLRGSQIYDLARIVSIANVFDEIVGESSGTLQERQLAAIQEIDQNRFKQFDPQKLDKALKILKLGV